MQCPVLCSPPPTAAAATTTATAAAAAVVAFMVSVHPAGVGFLGAIGCGAAATA